ncbi:hypothetical protein BJX99DRAFT_243388 [Aspergillus californicus]
MVIGVAMMAAMVPTTLALNEATRGQESSEAKRKENERRKVCHLTATCPIDADPATERGEVHNAKVYLGVDHKLTGRVKLYICKRPTDSMTAFKGHLFSLPELKEGNLNGLVAVSGELPPTLRWVYLNKSTYEMEWGGKNDREGHISGPFDMTRDENYLSLDSTQRWLAVRVGDAECESMEADIGLWRLLVDWDEDGGSFLPPGSESVHIFLRRDPESS